MSERENYQETMVPGSDLMLKCWTEGNRIMNLVASARHRAPHGNPANAVG